MQARAPKLEAMGRGWSKIHASWCLFQPKNIDNGKIGGPENKKLATELGTAEKACKKTKKAPGGKCNKVTGDASTCGDYFEVKPVSAAAKRQDKNAKGDNRVVCKPRTGGKISSPCVEGFAPPPKC